MLGIEEDFKVEKNIEKILKKSEWKIGKFWTKSRIHFKNIKKKKKKEENQEKLKETFLKNFIRLKENRKNYRKKSKI